MIAKHIEGLQYQRINEILGLNLTNDKVYLSELTAIHIKERHPNDYKICLDNIELIITEPDYVGQEPNHLQNYEMIKIIDGKIILIALNNKVDGFGDYAVMSSYLLDKNTFYRRLRKKHIHKFGK